MKDIVFNLIDEEKVKKHENQLKELNKRHQAELEEKNRKRKEEIAKLNKKHQEEIHNICATAKEYKKLIDRYRKLSKNPCSKMSQIYDLTNEDDIKEFISWHKVLHKKVKNQTVKAFTILLKIPYSFSNSFIVASIGFKFRASSTVNSILFLSPNIENFNFLYIHNLH